MTEREQELARKDEEIRQREAELARREQALDRSEAKPNWPFCELVLLFSVVGSFGPVLCKFLSLRYVPGTRVTLCYPPVFSSA